MKAVMTCASKFAQQPGVNDTPIMVVFNGPKGSVLHIACPTEDEANLFKLHKQYHISVGELTE